MLERKRGINKTNKSTESRCFTYGLVPSVLDVRLYSNYPVDVVVKFLSRLYDTKGALYYIEGSVI
jgi:hypothetical protein